MCEEDEQFCFEQLDFCKCSKKHERIYCLSPASWGQLDSSQCHNHSYTAGSLHRAGLLHLGRIGGTLSDRIWLFAAEDLVRSQSCYHHHILSYIVIYCHMGSLGLDGVGTLTL